MLCRKAQMMFWMPSQCQQPKIQIIVWPNPLWSDEGHLRDMNRIRHHRMFLVPKHPFQSIHQILDVLHNITCYIVLSGFSKFRILALPRRCATCKANGGTVAYSKKNSVTRCCHRNSYTPIRSTNNLKICHLQLQKIWNFWAWYCFATAHFRLSSCCHTRWSLNLALWRALHSSDIAAALYNMYCLVFQLLFLRYSESSYWLC